MLNQSTIAEQPQTLQTSQPEKMMPKYCTSVQVALLNNSNLILTLAFNEPGQSGVLIDRVIIDLVHADNLANVLKTAVQQASEKNAAILN